MELPFEEEGPVMTAVPETELASLFDFAEVAPAFSALLFVPRPLDAAWELVWFSFPPAATCLPRLVSTITHELNDEARVSTK